MCGTVLRRERVCGHGGAKEHKVGVRPHGAMEVVRRRWHEYGKSRCRGFKVRRRMAARGDGVVRRRWHGVGLWLARVG